MSAIAWNTHMVLAINEAANNWSGLDRALADLEAERKKARAALAR